MKEEDLKEQLEEKDKAYQQLEAEVVEPKKKAEQSEAHVKTSSSILDEILESQRSPFDKTGLGYGKTKKKTEEGPSFATSSCWLTSSFMLSISSSFSPS